MLKMIMSVIKLKKDSVSRKPFSTIKSDVANKTTRFYARGNVLSQSGRVISQSQVDNMRTDIINDTRY